MKKDDALEMIFSSLQYRELMDALEEARKQLSPDEWQEVSRMRMHKGIIINGHRIDYKWSITDPIVIPAMLQSL